MASVILNGHKTLTVGSLPAIGTVAPDFNLTKRDLTLVSLADFKGERLILSIFPSIDTGTCARSVRKFNKTAAAHINTRILCISKDLPDGAFITLLSRAIVVIDTRGKIRYTEQVPNTSDEPDYGAVLQTLMDD